MSRPTAGSQYTIVTGDTLSGISAAAYGSGKKWKVIWQANQSTLRSGNPDLIYPGEVIFIPPDKDIEAQKNALIGTKLKPPGEQSITIVIGGERLRCEAVRVFRSMETAADGWSATRFFNIDDLKFYDLIRPYGYQDALCYVADELVITGKVYGVSPSYQDRKITIEGWTKTVDLVDSTLKPGTYEASKVTLKQRAEQLAEPHGISVVFNLDQDTQFDRVKAEATETIGQHLGSLCTQRGALLTSAPNGDLVITRAITDEKPVAALAEDMPPLVDISATYDARQRFGVYRAIGQSSQKRKAAQSKDPSVQGSRFITVVADDARAGDITAAADWARNKVLANAMSISVTVNTFKDAFGNLWKENTLVNLRAPTMFIKKPTLFLIRAVEFELSLEGGEKAVLELVPPELYTGGEVAEPWLNK